MREWDCENPDNPEWGDCSFGVDLCPECDEIAPCHLDDCGMG